jgi:hypothetical protein
MNFQLNDAVDEALKATMVHELFICSERISEFKMLAFADSATRRLKAWKIRRHDAYSRFIHHQYEFWVAAAKRDALNTASVRFDVLDELLTLEAQKAIRNRHHSMEYLKPADWGVAIRLLKEVDDDFGKHFRLVRNRTAHASHRRAQSNVDDLTLGEFFIHFHQAVAILFETAKFAWTVKNVEEFEWMEIETFDLAVSASV